MVGHGTRTRVAAQLEKENTRLKQKLSETEVELSKLSQTKTAAQGSGSKQTSEDNPKMLDWKREQLLRLFMHRNE